jgi:hypothetical protein
MRDREAAPITRNFMFEDERRLAERAGSPRVHSEDP